jgi:adenosylmethionine-8-amino-7-oxononanoate aminotransferase
MAVAKGLGGGYLPLAAAILQERLWEPMAQRHGGLLTGHTFSGHTTACAAGAAVQTIVATPKPGSNHMAVSHCGGGAFGSEAQAR